jgi:hypothetical protein
LVEEARGFRLDILQKAIFDAVNANEPDHLSFAELGISSIFWQVVSATVLGTV